MSRLFTRNSETIDSINQKFHSESLIIDTTYQRRKVWMPQDKIRLIETILLDFVMPEVFFWPSEIDPSTGNTITHIVDGQQRISSIIEYINNSFELTEKSLLDNEIKDIYANKYFKDLTDDQKVKIWKYEISIVNINREVRREDIKQLFYRLNLTNYSLNSQEKLNSIESAFGDAAEALSKLDFWKESKVFSASDARRMQDIRYCCSIYILANEGIVDQTGDKKITDYYNDFSDTFDENESLLSIILESMAIISSFRDKSTQNFISKKAQMYTLFCVSMKMVEKNIESTSDIFKKFKLFVIAYNKFRNGVDPEFESDKSRELHENINKYKLASSEGINKVTNRVIRFEILYKIIIESDNTIIESLLDIAKKYNQEADPQLLLFEEFDSEDITDFKYDE